MNNTSAQKAIELEPTEQMLQIMSGFWVSRGIWVAAKLGISDFLTDGPKTAEELAKLTDTHADSLYRILRMLGDGRYLQRRWRTRLLSHSTFLKRCLQMQSAL
jgi:hypothetical protein